MKKLVVYYSVGGNTRAVARRVAQKLRADITEINTVKEYPDDYDVLVGLGKREVESGYIPQIQPLGIDLAQYDVIVLGTPVWWYTYAPAVKTFLMQNSAALKGKRVYPFATNGGWLGHTPSDMKRALRGSVAAPLFSVKFDEKEQVTPRIAVDEWIAEIK